MGRSADRFHSSKFLEFRPESVDHGAVKEKEFQQFTEGSGGEGGKGGAKDQYERKCRGGKGASDE